MQLQFFVFFYTFRMLISHETPEKKVAAKEEENKKTPTAATHKKK